MKVSTVLAEIYVDRVVDLPSANSVAIELGQINDSLVELVGVTGFSISSYLLAMGLNILPVILGAIAAHIFTNRHWQKVENVSKLAKRATEIEFLVDEIERLAVSYWLRDADANNRHDDRVSEVMLITKTVLASELMMTFLLDDTVKTKVSALTNLGRFKEEIYDVVTSDSFESRNRVSSTNKALAIAKLCSKARGELIRYKA